MTEQIYCMDWLGGARYPKVVLDNHPVGWGAGFFINVDGFGSCWNVARDLASSGKCPLFRFHAVWDDDHQYRPKEHDRLIMLRLDRTIQFKKDFPHIKVYFSPFCEHRIKGSALKVLFNKVREKAKGTGVILVNNPEKGDFMQDADILNEVHGYKAKPSRGKYIYSFDGTGCVDADSQGMKETHKDAVLFFFWTYQFNLLLNDNDKTDRQDRKAVPTTKLIDSVVYLKNHRGTVRYGQRQTLKSHADQHDTPVPEPRAFKPVYIIPQNVARLELRAKNGQIVAASSRAYVFDDGRWRYYFPEEGYILAEKAIRIQGDPVVDLVASDRVIARVNPAFRGGDYR